MTGRVEVARTLSLSRDWIDAGTALFLKQLDNLADGDFDRSCGLPGWRRRELVAHVSANAEALGNLVTWAATGVETPMYASPEDRARGIQEGAERPVAMLREWVTASSATLREAMDALSTSQWEAEVRTAQGRLVPASDIAWLRAREVMIHAVDLGEAVGFPDLDPAFLEEVGAEIAHKRDLIWSLDAVTGAARVSRPGFSVVGPAAEVAAWLAGRPFVGLVGQPDGVPELPSWL